MNLDDRIKYASICFKNSLVSWIVLKNDDCNDSSVVLALCQSSPGRARAAFDKDNSEVTAVKHSGSAPFTDLFLFEKGSPCRTQADFKFRVLLP